MLLTLDDCFYALAALDRWTWSGRPSASPRFALKDQLAAAARARDGFVTPRAAEPLPELPVHTTRDQLVEATDGLRRPVVLRGFGAKAPAVTRWTEAFLRERLGEVPCGVFVQDRDSRLRSWDVGTSMEHIPFATYLDRRRDEPLYLNNSTELFHAAPELLDDLQLDLIRSRFHTPGSRWDELMTANLFLGARHVFSSLHCAYGGNFFLQVSGRKRWVFVDPAYGPHLHALPGEPFQFLKTAYGGTRAAEEGGRDDVIGCLPRYTTVLEPGDLLYNPPWWWHEVDNLDDLTLGVALRHLPPITQGSPTWQNHRFWSLMSTWPRKQAVVSAHWLAAQVVPSLPSVRKLLEGQYQRDIHQGLARKA